MKSVRTIVMAAGAVLAAATAALGHVFWVAPSAYRVKPEELVKVELRVGDVFPGELVPRNDSRLEFLRVFAPGAAQPAEVVGRDGSVVVGILRPRVSGTSVIAYRSKPSEVTLEGEKFEAYLKDKGLEEVSVARKAAGETGAPGKEMFSRAAKALVVVSGGAGGAGGGTSSEGFDRTVGMRMEITPVTDPAGMEAGGEFVGKVEFEGKPLGKALITARCVEHPEWAVSGRSGEDGRVRLKLKGGGTWIVEGVHMVSAPAGSGARWESVWASVSFQTGGRGVGEGGAGAASGASGKGVGAEVGMGGTAAGVREAKR